MCLITCIYGAMVQSYKNIITRRSVILGSHQGAKRNLDEAQDAAQDGARAWHRRLVRRKWRFNGI